MNITTVKDEANLITIHYDADASVVIKRYAIWNEGFKRVVIAGVNEDAALVWQRVLKQVKDMRDAILPAERNDDYMHQKRYITGQAHSQTHVYADIEPTKEQVKAHEKERFIWSIWKLACDTKVDGAARVAALTMLAKTIGYIKQTS